MPAYLDTRLPSTLPLQGFAACITELVSGRGDVNKCRNDGASPIFAAAVRGNSECIPQLAALRGDVNKCNNDGVSPLHIAARYGQTACITAILSCGGNANAFISDGRSPLYMAAENGNMATNPALKSSFLTAAIRTNAETMGLLPFTSWLRKAVPPALRS